VGWTPRTTRPLRCHKGSQWLGVVALFTFGMVVVGARARILKKTHRRKKRVGGNPKAYQSRATAEYEHALRRHITGSHGAASPVRKIDPITGKVIEILDLPKS
jgi:hypothetical protein